MQAIFSAISFALGIYMTKFVKKKHLGIFASFIIGILLMYIGLGLELSRIINFQKSSIFRLGFWVINLGMASIGLWLSCLVRVMLEDIGINVKK